MKFPRLHLTIPQFLLLISLYYLALNATFLQYFFRVTAEAGPIDWPFLLSVPLFLYAVLLLLFSLFGFRLWIKPLFILLTLLSSLVFYGEIAYGTVFDYDMIVNVFQTDQREAASYLNWKSIASFIVTGLLPAALIANWKIRPLPLKQTIGQRLLLLGGALLVIITIAFLFYESYAATFRNHRILKRYLIPSQFVDSTVKYLYRTYFKTPLTHTQLGTDAHLAADWQQGKPKVVVMVMGETARAQNYQYNGYPRPTNAHTQPLGLINFRHVTSCGTATAISLPCIFSDLPREQFDREQAAFRDNVLDIIQRGGSEVVWIDNDSGCKKVCDRVRSEIIQPKNLSSPLCDGHYCFDEILLPKLEAELQTVKGPQKVIVLHIIGSHGPTYYRRYPAQHRFFTPDCPTSNIQHCDRQALVNTYDNTIRYTDYIIAEVIKRLQAQTDVDSALIYLSDHGESLGENHLYLHGFPYAMAPPEQTRVPLHFWFSDNFARLAGYNKQCLNRRGREGHYSHDNIFATLLGLTRTRTTVYNPQMDILAACQQPQG